MDKSIIIAILSPILLTTGGIISWFLKSKKDSLIAEEEKAREFKIRTYQTLLEPFIATFTFNLDETEKLKEIGKLKTLEYKKAAFDLMTFGSDDAIRSFNSLMQSFYNKKITDFNNDTEYAVYFLREISELLLMIRQDVYTKKTILKRSDMIAFMITDIELHKAKINSSDKTLN